MKLINEIIAEAVDSEKTVSNLLRKCLVLSFDLSNNKLKAWVESELNGYNDDKSVPEYRKAILYSKGNFIGPFGGIMTHRPLPMAILKKEHRDSLIPTYFSQPIAAFETTKTGEGSYVLNWSPDLIGIYQNKFIQGWGLSSAWQEIPENFFRAIVDTVKTRVLRFALEIRSELGLVDDEPAKLPAAKVEAAVNTFIIGGNNVINSQVEHLSQQGNTTIMQGDFGALTKALKEIGIDDSDIDGLKKATEQDAAKQEPGIGKKTSTWLTKLGAKMGGAGWTVGTAAGVEIVKQLIVKYLGG
jgi:hypothetical protein